VTHSIYDGRGEVRKVVTYKNGELQHEDRGTGKHGSDSAVSYDKGKKHGEERVYSKKGKLSQTINWNLGVKDGKELKYAEDGKRIVSETVWAAGEMQQVTEFYLNGNTKSLITVGPEKKEVKIFWDTGKLKDEGNMLRCKTGYSKWCKDGIEKEYYESGSMKSETNWKADKQDGTTKNWWENGRLSKVEEYDAGLLTSRKTWDKEGKLTADEQYESDGSRKLKR
jgi:antitoxin component YwqK of YwqJK toxin-antitoxin module